MIAAASLANLLCAATAGRLGRAARARLAAGERLHDELAELDTAPLARLGGGNRA